MLRSVGVGLLATLAVLGAYALGWLDWVELKTLDWRFRYASSVPEDPRIVCIDIDDDALRMFQRWPWPRDVQAGLLSILFDAGLNTLLCDIEFGEAETVRSVIPRLADVTVDRFGLRLEDAPLAYPDDELRLAIRNAARVYLAFHYETAPKSESAPGSLSARVREWAGKHPTLWNEPVPELFERVLSEIADGDPRQLEATAVALRDALSHAATVRNPILPVDRVRAASRAVPAIAPVHFEQARAAKRCGFVVFEPDIDGVVRHMRLLVHHDDVVLPQLAFAVAYDELELTPDDVIASERSLTLHSPKLGEPLVIQLDHRGRTLVPWLSEPDWTRQFGQHIPVDVVWQIFDRRQKIRLNLETLRDTLAALLESGGFESWRQYHDDLRRSLELEGELRLARYRGEDEQASEVERWITQYSPLLAEAQARMRLELPDRIEATSQSGSTRDAEALPLLRALERVFRANDEHRRIVDSTFAWLRARVQGKIGLLGYTASAVADMAPIPTNPRAPGVVAHANLLNGLLTGRMVYWAPTWLNVLIAGLAGVLGTLVSARWSPRIVGLLALLAAAYVALAGLLAFYAWSYWIALTPGVVALLLCYVTIVVFRFLFLERESRQIARALSQYTSATLATQMAEDAELCKRAETREVTTVFTDLANFTTISEHIGAQRTQNVLNIALGRFSDVMIRHEGMVNKFIGDGVFAFWNPVIYPQPDHARRACASAIDLQRALRALIEEQRIGGGDPVFRELVLRVGAATGNAVVGPCGSEQKYDYTCIGDSVNVASRLESANKFYGTRILVSAATQAQAGDGFAYRWLGGVQVKGKTQAVQIYELLGWADSVDQELLRYAESFAGGVAAFQRRDWAAARAAFQQCLTPCPDDRAAREYLQAADRYAGQAPPDDWSGAIELTEK